MSFTDWLFFAAFSLASGWLVGAIIQAAKAIEQGAI